MSIQHTTNTSMHQLVNVNQHVDSTHNQHVHSRNSQHVHSTHNQHINASVSKRQPTVDSTHNQHVNSPVSKRQSTYRLNTSTNTSTHQSVDTKQLVGSIHQLIADCLVCIACQFNTTNMSNPVQYIG